MRIRDGQNSDPGSRINILVPQHWFLAALLTDKLKKVTGG
jgi:hypothetical protein